MSGPAVGNALPITIAGVNRLAGIRSRLARLSVTELRLLQRFQVLTAAAVTTTIWVVVLRLVSGDVRAAIGPAILLLDVASLGFLFVPTLVVLERTEGVEAALGVTPVRPAERVAVRAGCVGALSVVAGAVVCVVAELPAIGVRLGAVALLALLFDLLAVALVGSSATLTSFLTRAPFVAAPLVAPALVRLVDPSSTPLVLISPVAGGVDLLRGTANAGTLAWLAAWVVGAAVVAVRVTGHRSRGGEPVRSDEAVTVAAAARPVAWSAHSGTYRRSTAVRSLARADRRALLGDGLLLMIAASVPLLTLVLRIAATVGDDWVRARYGVALAPHLPLVESLVLVVHTPVVFGSLTGLLLLEDSDAGLLGPLATTRAGLGTLLAYRLGATVAVTAGALVICLPATGIAHPAGPAGVVATAVVGGAVSVIPALIMAAYATNRVQGVAVMKLLGLPLYLPLATWVLDGPLRWLFTVFPTSWLVWAGWASSPLDALAVAAVGVGAAGATSVPLVRRFLRRAI